jgi:hypothetical protein
MATTKVWNKGTNAVLTEDFEGFPKGTKCWIFDSTTNPEVLKVLTKREKDGVAKDFATKFVNVPMAQSESFVKTCIGKPRKDFDEVLVPQSEVDRIIAEKMGS